MSIQTAVQQGNAVLVYDETGAVLCTIYGTLHGYTGSTVSTKEGNRVSVYDERGVLLNNYAG